MIGFLQPLYKFFVHFVYAGKLGQTPVKLVAVVVNQLAGDYRHPLIQSAVKVVVSPLQKRQKLAGEGLGAFRKICVGRVYRYARLRRIGNNYLQIFAFAVCEISFILLEGVYKVAYYVYNAALFNLFAVVYALQAQGVQAVLLFQFLNPAERHRLNDGNARVDCAVVVEALNYPIDKRP